MASAPTDQELIAFARQLIGSTPGVAHDIAADVLKDREVWATLYHAAKRPAHSGRAA